MSGIHNSETHKEITEIFQYVISKSPYKTRNSLFYI